MKPEQPDITYIVSAYNRPLMLPVCLWSIKGQTHQNFEAIVTDNAVDEKIAAQHKQIVAGLHDKRFSYLRTAGKIKVSDCYWSAEYALKRARGSWLCFPCDDTYLVPGFAAQLLTAAMERSLDFVYSKKVIVGPVAFGGVGYHVWDMDYVRLMTIKTSFIVRRSKFPGFAAKPDKVACAIGADSYLAVQMQQMGARIGGVDQVMVVHN